MKANLSLLALVLAGLAGESHAQQQADPATSAARRPTDDADLRYWLENMIWHHRFSTAEAAAATGLTESEIDSALSRFQIRQDNKPPAKDKRLLVLPYPGGRHPRIGFLEGAIKPQRETKVSVFAPWDAASYVVADVPEAIWSNLGLTYLAHTHVETLWTKQGIQLAAQEWQRAADGTYLLERRLPNGIVFGTKVIPAEDAVHFEMWLINQTAQTLTDLRVQNCMMLKGLAGFEQQNNDNKVIQAPYVAAHDTDGRRWVITAWEPVHRPWANPRCPCIHADPKFPDCEPGQIQRLRGWLSFYEGDDLQQELARIDASGWKQREFTTAASTRVEGTIVDAATGKPLPARIHVRDADGNWHLVHSDRAAGSHVHYRKQRPNMPHSVEVHTTLSAHPFAARLPRGTYQLRVERGKEYVPLIREVTLRGEVAQWRLPLRRWIDMSERGWYSGDTHVHRSIDELPNVMLAEDLNVALPLSYWVRESGVPPLLVPGAKESVVSGGLLEIDPTHVIYPMNSEYELFRVGNRRHTLGAVFVLNHQRALKTTTPPVRPIAVEARSQHALLDLDKHSWPWSLMLVPIMDVDLFELSNNHVWQTEFGFKRWTIDAIGQWQIERDADGFTEWGWIDFGFKTYYALLNCGFRMRVSAGTASGVHPVQLGFGRVYVHLPDGFSYQEWMAGLDQGRSFVTTGPMLEIEFNGQSPGHTFSGDATEFELAIRGTASSSRPLARIEVIVNGEVRQTLEPANSVQNPGGYVSQIDTRVRTDESAWVAVRCFQEHPAGRVRFAHTNPVHIDLPGKPVRPTKREVQFFIRRMQDELERNKDVLDNASLAEYQAALQQYQRIAETAR